MVLRLSLQRNNEVEMFYLLLFIKYCVTQEESLGLWVGPYVSSCATSWLTYLFFIEIHPPRTPFRTFTPSESGNGQNNHCRASHCGIKHLLPNYSNKYTLCFTYTYHHNHIYIKISLSKYNYAYKVNHYSHHSVFPLCAKYACLQCTYTIYYKYMYIYR